MRILTGACCATVCMSTDVAALFDLAGQKGAARKKTNTKKATQEEETVATCGKDDRVGTLHAVGRILYPKCKS